MEKLKQKIQNIFWDIIDEWEWTWLHLLISILCDLEMNFRLLKAKQFRRELMLSDCYYPLDDPEDSPAHHNIPQQSLYCNGCPYYSSSKLADTILGDQYSGYCYYLNRGDYSFSRPTDLLWDGCKECDINYP